MKIYNTLSRKKEEFKPISGKTVKIYTCGPTVYDYAHIGNLRTYINEDLLRRTLKYMGYKIEQVMNITDIEDKIIARAKKEKKNYKEVTKKYEKAFFEDLKKLNIESVEHIPHATDPKVVEKMIQIIQKLLDTGYAYKSDDGSIYFSIKKFKNYGKLSGLDKREIKVGARVAQDEYEKDNAQDFALWKAKKEGEPSWKAPFGEGRPGWHIECSAMSTMFLGDTIDIHAGAVDLIFPHHENEIAQSEAFTGKKFVNYWWHPEFLLVEGKKMSKSLKNIYTLDEICKKYNVEPLAFRMLCLQSHYRDKLNFTRDSIGAAYTTLVNLDYFMRRLLELKNPGINIKVDQMITATKKDFENALNDDLNIPEALAGLYKLINKTKVYFDNGLGYKEGNKIKKFILESDKIFGLDLDKVIIPKETHDIQLLINKRENARLNSDFKKADKIRKVVEKQGYLIEDTPTGPRLRKK